MRVASERMLIGGELVGSASGQWDDSVNPATEEIIGRSPAGDKIDIDLAVASAEAAWPTWAAKTADERSAH